MKRILGGLLLFVALAAHADKVDKFIRQEMQQHDIAGLGLTIVKDGKRVKTEGYGFANLEHRVPVTKETVFEIGSVSKQFTSAAIMVLQQDGKLSVDDKISKYFTNAPAIWKDITIRHLITHTSGLKNINSLDGFELRLHLTQQKFIEQLGAVPLEFKPGEKWSYCNSGYCLLGYIIENVSGKNYWEFLGQRIFAPCEMYDTTNREPRHLILHRAAGYEKDRQKNTVHRDADLTDIFAAGAIASTTVDMAKWEDALVHDRILTPASKAMMWTPTPLPDGKQKEYGFAWYVNPLHGHKNIGHSGSTSGFSASFQRFPDDDLTIILLTNSDEGGVATVLAKKLATLLLEPEKAEAASDEKK